MFPRPPTSLRALAVFVFSVYFCGCDSVCAVPFGPMERLVVEGGRSCPKVGVSPCKRGWGGGKGGVLICYLP